MELQIKTLDELGAAAQTFAQRIGRSRVIAFYGSMGAGKTTFIRALCRALGVQEPVTSPTFAIVNEYHAMIDDLRLMNDESEGNTICIHQSSIHQSSITKVFHFDFYRIRRIEEAYDMGFEDYLYSGHLCLIEWPELIEDLLPDDTVRVHITAADDGSRTISW